MGQTTVTDFRAIYHRLMAEGVGVEMVASTGIAATLLEGGMTAHRKFFLPLNMKEGVNSKV